MTKPTQHVKDSLTTEDVICGFMILTSTPEHGGGMRCAEDYPCKIHGEWKAKVKPSKTMGLKKIEKLFKGNYISVNDSYVNVPDKTEIIDKINEIIDRLNELQKEEVEVEK